MVITVVLADKQPLILYALETLLSKEPNLKVLASCAHADELVVAVNMHTPDVLVTNSELLGKDCLAILRKIDKCGTHIVLLAENSQSLQLLDYMRCGVQGIVTKDMALEFLIHCIHKVYAGGEWLDRDFMRKTLGNLLQSPSDKSVGVKGLSPHEEKIALLVTDGYSNKEIARKINSTEGAVKAFLHRIYCKLEIKGRINLAMMMRKTHL